MAIICDDLDLLFTHVPKTGGMFVERLLLDHVGGRKVGRRHATLRWLPLDDLPTHRVFVVRDPLSWYQSYWAYARGIVRHRAAWPIWESGRRDHPTHALDQTCGSPTFEGFVTNSLSAFPNGFLRSMYCDFLNGATACLRTERLARDVAVLLHQLGVIDTRFVMEASVVNESDRRWKEEATLSPPLEARLREVENLVGLALPYVGDGD